MIFLNQTHPYKAWWRYVLINNISRKNIVLESVVTFMDHFTTADFTYLTCISVNITEALLLKQSAKVFV